MLGASWKTFEEVFRFTVCSTQSTQKLGSCCLKRVYTGAFIQSEKRHFGSRNLFPDLSHLVEPNYPLIPNLLAKRALFDASHACPTMLFWDLLISISSCPENIPSEQLAGELRWLSKWFTNQAPFLHSDRRVERSA